MAEEPQTPQHSNLIVIGFGNEYAADAMIAKLEEWQEQGLIELEDAVRARRGVTEHVEVKQAKKLMSKEHKSGMLGGLLGGGLWGGMKDVGIDDGFIRETAGWLRPESSMVFLLVKSSKAEEILPKLKSFEDAQLLSTTLDPEKERLLRSAVEKRNY
jgi:uncharacterized membrane protein